ncbi:MAG: flagellar basal body-associated FliL family protein [Bacillota bacterium]|jgi:flagellar FliL protein
MKQKNKENDSGEDMQKKSGKRKIIIICLMVFVLTVAVNVMVFSNKTVLKAWSKHLKADEVDILSFEEVLVNLSDINYSHYLKTSIVLEYQGKKLGKELNDKTYRVKDTIIKVLRKKSTEDLDTAEEINKLKKELLTQINTQLKEGKVDSVYFEDFIIQ